jgi:hypothetical protein
VHRRKPARPQHLVQSEGVGLVALDPPALDCIGHPAGVHAYHWIAHRRERAEEMRRERPAFQPNLGELTVKTLQSSVDHLQMRVDYAPPHNLAGLVYNAHRRPLAPNVKSCKHGHRCPPFVVRESPAKASPLPPESSNLMYGMY